MSHLLGSERGDPAGAGLFGVESGALPEALQVVRKGDEQKQIKCCLTIDLDLQQA